MKIMVEGKVHKKGISKRTGNPYDFSEVHFLAPAPRVDGLAAKTCTVDVGVLPYDSIRVGSTYDADVGFDGHVYGFELVD